MKKFLSILLAVMMVLSSVSYAALHSQVLPTRQLKCLFMKYL